MLCLVFVMFRGALIFCVLASSDALGLLGLRESAKVLFMHFCAADVLLECPLTLVSLEPSPGRVVCVTQVHRSPSGQGLIACQR